MPDAWVCPECAIDYGDLDVAGLGGRIRAFPDQFRAALAGRDDAVLRRRPNTSTWSPQEYAGHVADVLHDLGGIVAAMATDGPISEGFLNDPDEQAMRERYNERDADKILDTLAKQAETTAQTFDAVGPDGWTKEADFPWGRRDALTMARNAVHECHHHLMDVNRILAAS